MRMGAVPTQGVFERIYAAVRRVPPGRVVTYGEIARQVGLRNGARTVGWALASLPDGEAAPWWRVVRGDGTIANRLHAAEQRKRLRREGVRLLVAIVAFAVISAPAVAAAMQHTTAVSDPRDPAGQLDLRRLVAIQEKRTGPLGVTITTWAAWDRSVLAGSGSNRLMVLFDTNGDGRAEYEGRIVLSSGELVLLISGSGSQFEPLPVGRPNRTTLTLVVPGSSPPNPADRRVRIAVQSVYVKKGTSCAARCVDRIPDAGWLTAGARPATPPARQ